MFGDLQKTDADRELENNPNAVLLKWEFACWRRREGQQWLWNGFRTTYRWQKFPSEMLTATEHILISTTISRPFHGEHTEQTGIGPTSNTCPKGELVRSAGIVME